MSYAGRSVTVNRAKEMKTVSSIFQCFCMRIYRIKIKSYTF